MIFLEGPAQRTIAGLHDMQSYRCKHVTELTEEIFAVSGPFQCDTWAGRRGLEHLI